MGPGACRHTRIVRTEAIWQVERGSRRADRRTQSGLCGKVRSSEGLHEDFPAMQKPSNSDLNRGTFLPSRPRKCAKAARRKCQNASSTPLYNQQIAAINTHILTDTCPPTGCWLLAFGSLLSSVITNGSEWHQLDKPPSCACH